MVSDAGGKKGYVHRSRWAVYRAVPGSKQKKARIANAGITAAGRSRMAKKAARTRKRNKRKR